MGRQSGDPTAVGSSIALLQERFKQLEKMREKREERELLKMFSESEQVTQTNCFEPPKLPFQPRPPLHGSLSLGLDLYSKHADFRPVKTTPSTNLWSTDAASVSTSRTNEKSDVDTSLHL